MHQRTSAQLGSSNSCCQDTEQLRDKPHFSLDVPPSRCKWSLDTVRLETASCRSCSSLAIHPAQRGSQLQACFTSPVFLQAGSSGAVVPFVAAAVGRPPIRGAALRAGGAGGLAGVGLPHGRQASTLRVHQVLGHCKRAERSISHCPPARWATGDGQRGVLISKRSTPHSFQGDAGNQVGPNTS